MNKVFKKIIKDHKNTVCFKSVEENRGIAVAGYLFLENNCKTARELYYMRDSYSTCSQLFTAESIMGLKPYHRFSRGYHSREKKIYFIGKVIDFNDRPVVVVDEFVSYKEYLKFLRENRETRKKLAYSGNYLIDNLHKRFFGGRREECGECLVIGANVYDENGKYIGGSRDYLQSNGEFVERYF